MNVGTRTVWLAIWSAALGLWLATPSLSHAQLLRAELKVNGLTCPFCAFGIEKKLRAVNGVEEVDVLLDEGEVRLTLAAGNTATVGALENAVEEGGFGLAGLRVEVQGVVNGRDGDPLLEANDAVRFRLLELDNGRPRPISDARLKEILAEAADGAVRVVGTVDGDGEGPRELVIDGALPARRGAH